MSTMTTEDRDYVLGTHDVELQRLGFQNRLWSDTTMQHWKRAGFGPGKTILDIGCGPGFATRDLAQLLGPKGRIIAIDAAKKYVDFVNAAPIRPGMSPIETIRADVQTMQLPESCADGGYMRWLLMWVPEPERVIQAAAPAIRSGGHIAIMDYYDWAALNWGPRQETLAILRRAITSMHAEHKAHLQIGQKLPGWLDRHGFDLVDIKPVVRAARPHEALWQWPETYFNDLLPRLVQMGHLTEDEFQAWSAEWRSNSTDPAGFFMTPAMVAIVGRKR